MYEHFTEKAIKVIMLAQEEARRLRHNFVGTEQILLGLSGEGTGIAAKVLRSHNVKLKDLRATVLGIIGKGSGSVSVETPFTPNAKKLLEAAWNAARDLGHNYIGTEHLLLGLLAADDCTAKQVLSILNVDLEKMKGDVLDSISMANKKQQLASANPAHVPASAPGQSQSLVRSAKGPVAGPSAKEQVTKSNVTHLFSESAIRSMQLAQEEARLVGSAKLELQHLLLGILAEGSSEAAKLLTAKSIKLEELRLATMPEEEVTPSESSSQDFELSKQVVFSVEMASVAARTSGSVLITPEFLLFALISYEESRAVKGLQKLGVNIELFAEELRSVIKALSIAQVQAAEAAKEARAAESASLADLPFSVEDSETGNQINLSHRSIETVVAAMAQAHALGHNFVSTEFLLLGLFAPTGGMARQALMNCGASEEMVLLVIEQLLGSGPGSTDLPVPSTSNAREAFKLAVGKAESFSCDLVEPEHLLLGLLAIKDSTAYRILENLGVDPAAVCARLVSSTAPRRPIGIEESKQSDLALTEMVEHAIVLATEEAHRLGHVEVDTDHLLLGLMTEADGLASLALHVWDVKTKELRQESENMPGREKVETPCASRCGSKVNELVLAARKLALEAKLSYVGTDHVLLALLADEDSAGLKVLRNLSIDTARLKKMLQNANLPPRIDAKYSSLVPLAKQRGFERFSEEAIKALMFAKEEAFRLGHSRIDSQFLLLGICDERLNKGADRLRKIGISLDDLRFEVEHLTGYGDGDCGSGFSFGEHALQAIRWSFVTVIAAGIEVIRPEHLFVGIILEESGPAFALLQQFNVSIDRLRASTVLRLRNDVKDPVIASGRDKVRGLFDSGDASICDLLSQGSFNSILRGQLEAKALSQELLEPCHILLGLLGESTGLAVKTAEFMGLEVNQLRLGVQRMLGKIILSPAEISLSTHTCTALADARVLAELCKSDLIEPDHLFVAILKDSSCLKIFNDANQDYKKFYDTALGLLKADKPNLFAREETALEGSAAPPFVKLTDNDIDQLFDRAAGSSEHLAMRVFSSTAQNAIRLAVNEARRLGRAQVGTDHLLVGILSEQDSVAAKALEAIGITRGSLRAAIEKEFGVGNSTSAEDLPFSKNAILAFEKSFEAAKAFGFNTIGTDQLLIGILGLQKVLDRGSLSREDCAGVVILRSLGVDLGSFRQLVINKLKAPNLDIRAFEGQGLPQSKKFTYSDMAIKRFANFAADALKVVIVAHEEARENRLSLVGTEQILLALVLDAEGKAGAILKTLGVTAEKVRAEIDRFIQNGPGISHSDEPYTSEAISVFHLARLGASFVEGKVGTEHLLLAIITNQRYLASIILGRAGVDVAKLQEIMADEQTALSELVENESLEKTAAAKSRGEVVSESLPVVDYSAALAEFSNPIKLPGYEQGLQAVHEMLQGSTQEDTSQQQEDDWAALKERFTANLRTAIDLAKTDSCNRNKGIVDAPQLLFALLNLSSNSCANHLKTLNLDRFDLRDRLGEILHITEPRSASAFVGFSALANQVLLRAFQLSAFEGVGWVQTKHLLLALIESDDEKFVPFMAAIGLRPDLQVVVSEQKPALQAEPIAAPDLSQTALNQDALGITATAERAMKLAANEAKLMGHNFVGTEQVMLGLIAAGNSVGGQVLLRQGLILLEVRHRVKAIIGLGAGAVADELPYTPRTKRMLDLALNEAQRLKHEEIGTGHILLGLLREGHGVAARVLTELGLNLDTLIEETEILLLEDMERKSSGSGEFER